MHRKIPRAKYHQKIYGEENKEKKKKKKQQRSTLSGQVTPKVLGILHLVRSSLGSRNHPTDLMEVVRYSFSLYLLQHCSWLWLTYWLSYICKHHPPIYRPYHVGSTQCRAKRTNRHRSVPDPSRPSTHRVYVFHGNNGPDDLRSWIRGLWLWSLPDWWRVGGSRAGWSMGLGFA